MAKGALPAWDSRSGAPFAAYNKSAVRARLRLKVDARRGRNDPRKSAKVRWAWRTLEVSPAGHIFPRGSVVGRQSPYERTLQQASVGSKTGSGARTVFFVMAYVACMLFLRKFQ